MFANTKNFIISANRLANRNMAYCGDKVFTRKLHISSMLSNKTEPELFPIPNNIDAAETTRFSQHRARDISATTILAQNGQSPMNIRSIDITADNTFSAANESNNSSSDPHLQSYDCFGAVSLNSVMQSNVPQPFGGMHKFSHLNMPAGQWSQEYKFTSQNLHSSHYTTLREQTRANWSDYDENATLQNMSNKDDKHKEAQLTTTSTSSPTTTTKVSATGRNQQFCPQVTFKRSYSVKAQTASETTKDLNKEQSSENPTIPPLKESLIIEKSTDPSDHLKENLITEKSINLINKKSTKDEQCEAPLSKKEQLKKVFKEYGATVVIFHVSISLVSLGCCYLLVSGGLDMVAVLNYIGLGESLIATKIPTSASTFVVAYAIHKIFSPVRITITLGATPLIVRYLRSKGILKKK